MAQKTTPKKISQKQRLQSELDSLAADIDEEGLLFLIKQANILIHNQRTKKLNSEIEELNRTKSKTAKDKPPADHGFTIEIERSASGKNYHFTVNGKKHFFDIPETQTIIQLCYKPETKSAALHFLYQFFENERDDILMEHSIESEKSPFFDALFRAVRSNFTL